MNMKFNILLVDDEKDISDSLTYLLESEGYEVYTASNGAQAEEIVREKEIDFAILDYILEDSTGVQVAKILHEIDKNIGFMFFSGHSEVSDIENKLDFSVREIFLKPIDPDDFLEKMRNIVMKKQ
jgi:DNA-binding response OmpR family regulator